MLGLADTHTHKQPGESEALMGGGAKFGWNCDGWNKRFRAVASNSKIRINFDLIP